MNSSLLSLAIWTPIVGAFIVLLTGDDRNARIARPLALISAIVGFLVTIPLYTGFDHSAAGMQFVEQYAWIKRFYINYHLGVDGISVLFVLLNSFITIFVVVAAWEVIETKVAQYMAAFLMMSGLINGIFSSLDGVLFYVFFEASLIPMYIIIGIWGGPNRVYAAIKFFLYTFVGSVLMLVAILVLYFHHYAVAGFYTTDLLKLYELAIPAKLQFWLFAAFFLAFAFKVPMFPFHTWLPDAHVEAPTAGSVILAAVLLKMGTYGFLRFSMALFPAAAADFTPLIATLAVIGIVYGALVSMVQKDIKKLVAYSSVSHLGFVMLGLFAGNLQGIEGGILQMINHGVSTGALFLIVGIVYERRHTRLISEFGGLSKVVPVFAFCFMVVTLSSIGLPGTNGFVGEFLILLGAFRTHMGLTVVAASGVILAAVYMLWMFQRVMFGKVTNEENLRLRDMNGREIAYMLPLLVLVFWIGVYPQPFLRRMDATVHAFVARVEAGKRAALAEAPPGRTMFTRTFDARK